MFLVWVHWVEDFEDIAVRPELWNLWITVVAANSYEVVSKADHEILQTDLNQLQTWLDKW